MAVIIDPSADRLWGSVAVIIDSDGTLEKTPKTDEEWAVVRGDVVTLVEASNLIQMPGRPIAGPGAKPFYPSVELEFEEIDRLINEDWAAWNELALALHDTSTAALKVIEARDAEGLRDAGVQIYGACESCHLKYWYPPRPMPANAPPQ